MGMSRAQLSAALWGLLQRQFTEVGIENEDSTGNLKEPVDFTLLALGTSYDDLTTGTVASADVGKAMIRQGELYRGVRRFMEEHEFLIAVVNQVPPFDHDIRYPTEIDGTQLDTYLDWMRSAYWISATTLPAVSAPGGFTPEGLPVGIQIIGRPGDDFGVLQLAHAFEQATGHWKTRPAIAR